MNKSSIIIKLGLTFSIFFILTILSLSFINIFIADKNFKISEMEKVKILLDTINPVLALNLSFGFSELSETLDLLFKNNNILAVKIIKDDEIIYLKYSKDEYKDIFNKNIVNHFHQKEDILDPFSNTKIALINIVYSNQNYKNMINEYILYISIPIVISLIFFTLLLYFSHLTLLPLKNLAHKMKDFSPKKKNFTIHKISGEDEIAIINNSAKVMIEKINEYTYKLEDINKNLKNQVKIEVRKSREKDKLLIEQSRQAAMGEMIGNIAHQWRQPLNALGLVLQNVQISYQRGKLNDEQVDRIVTKGMKLINKMSTTIDDFRNFFKPNKIKEKFNIYKAINDSLQLIEASLKNNNISVEIKAKNIYIIYGYPNEFSQVILNLLSNAKDVLIDRKVQNAKIIINIYGNNLNFIIELEDNAGGVNKEIIDKIFEPYFTTKDEGKGTGIGLYMSKMIIEGNMSGKITVSNTELGAIFKIILPKKDN